MADQTLPSRDLRQLQQAPHNLTQRYILALSLVGALAIIGQVLIQRTLQLQADDARVINVAAQQIALSERITKSVLAAHEDSDPISNVNYLQELADALALWQRTQNGLRYGDALLGLPGANNAAVAAQLAQVELPYETMRAAAQCFLLLNGFEGGNLACLDGLQTYAPTSIFSGMDALPEACATSTGVNRDFSCVRLDEVLLGLILLNEDGYTQIMEDVVALYEAESEAQLARLRTIELGLLLVTLVVLLIEAAFVFRPAVQTVNAFVRQMSLSRSQLQGVNYALEERVRERTAALEASNRRLVVANEEMRNFTSIVSHDLRSPVASMRGFLKELRADYEQVRASLAAAGAYSGGGSQAAVVNHYIPESMDMIDSAVAQMERLTASILSLSREQRRTLMFEWLQPSDIVHQVIQSQAGQLRAAKAQIIVPHRLPNVKADPVALEQIFANLIGNAVKYADPNRTPVIRVQAQNTETHLVLSVSDNGVGIPAEEQDKIFQLYKRVGATDGPIAGEGIGLYAVRQLVTRHGGQIDLTSQPGEGSTFRFSIAHNLEASTLEDTQDD